MNSWTRFFLVLLRLAIGWHFLYEGMEKIHSIDVGVTETNRPWSARPYLKEAVGPLAKYFRGVAGDTDEEALALLKVKPLEGNQDPAKVSARQRISPVLDQAWDEYLRRFEAKYQLTDQQKKEAETKLEQAKDQAVHWLLGETGTKEVEHTFPTGSVKRQLTGKERMQDYVDKVKEIKEIEEKKLPSFDRDVAKAKLRTLKAEASKLRTELLADLEKPMIDSLQVVLTDEQKKLGAATDLPPETEKPWYSKTRLEWIDWTTRYGLVAIGIGLLLGVFTRLSCLGGAAFLLMFYLSQPPFPWVPENTRTEGHYLFINKNLIEMLALLALATTRSGCWAGLDGLLQFCCPRCCRTRKPESSL